MMRTLCPDPGPLRPLRPARSATRGGRVTHWLEIVAAGVGRACVPLIGTPPFLSRKGPRANTIQISRSREGALGFGVVTDVTDACAASRAAYRPKVEISGGKMIVEGMQKAIRVNRL